VEVFEARRVIARSKIGQISSQSDTCYLSGGEVF